MAMIIINRLSTVTILNETNLPKEENTEIGVTLFSAEHKQLNKVFTSGQKAKDHIEDLNSSKLHRKTN